MYWLPAARVIASSDLARNENIPHLFIPAVPVRATCLMERLRGVVPVIDVLATRIWQVLAEQVIHSLSQSGFT